MNNDFITLTYGIEQNNLRKLNFIKSYSIILLYFFKTNWNINTILAAFIYFVKKFKKVNLNFKDKKILFLIFINFIPIC